MKPPPIWQVVTLHLLVFGTLFAEDIPPPPDYAEIGRNQQALMKYDPTPSNAKVPKSVQDAFYRGDYSLLDRLASDKNVNELLTILQCSVPISFGEHIFQPVPLQGPSRDPNYYKPNMEFGARVREQVKTRLAAIPGHTRILVEGIEAASKLKGGHGMRLGNIRFLGRIGSMEAIQQLGRYLSDDRNLEGYYFYGGPDSGMNPPVENSYEATVALRHALGDASPIPVRYGIIEGFAGGESVETMRTWWKSDAARPYREWNFDEYEPMPPPRKRAASLKPPSLKAMHPPISTVPVSVDSNRTVAWPVVVIICLAALAAILGFTKLKRGV